MQFQYVILKVYQLSKRMTLKKINFSLEVPKTENLILTFCPCCAIVYLDIGQTGWGVHQKIDNLTNIKS